MPNDQPAPPTCPSRSPAGSALPIIDRNRCEGKADCVRVCPYDVFEVRRLSKPEREGMSAFGTLRALAHGYRQAVVVRPADCHACGLCVKSCPERAITLRRSDPPPVPPER